MAPGPPPKASALVPAAPAGWKLDAPPVYPLASSTCKGATFQRVSYTVSYTNLTRVADANRRAEERDRRWAAIRRAHEESVQPQIMEISKRFQSESEGPSNIVRVTVESNGGKVSMRADGDPALAAEIIH